MERLGSQVKSSVVVVEKGKGRSRMDHLATEEPLEIRLTVPQRTFAITMRTPRADFELAAGFLYNEGIISNRTDILRLSYCVDPEIDGSQRYNIVDVALNGSVNPDLRSPERHFYTSSAYSVCGKARACFKANPVDCRFFGRDAPEKSTIYWVLKQTLGLL